MAAPGPGADGTGQGPRIWRFRDRRLVLGRRLRLMGVLNVTPDSFSDGGEWLDPERAVAHGRTLLAEGASVIDVGGESTRPGAAPVAAAEEIRRVVPVIRALRRAAPDAALSVDTRKAAVAAAALEAGADIVNDVSALGDPGMAELVRATGAGLVLMHMRGEPATMQADPRYTDVRAEVRAFLAERLDRARAAGIAEDRIVLDPGIGFGKRTPHNLALLARPEAFRLRNRPLLVGLSRKRLLGALTGRGVGDRLAAGLGLLAWLALRGADLARVHDVAASVDIARVLAIMTAQERRDVGA